MMESAVRPYLMDLGSTNGSFLNNERLEAQRFYELYEKVNACGSCSPHSPASIVLIGLLLCRHAKK